MRNQVAAAIEAPYEQLKDELGKQGQLFMDESPTNTAERALRPVVIYRKPSFGDQSESGSRFIERMLTVSGTCRLQNRSAYDYLTKAVTAYFSKQAAPSLLPNP